LGGVCDLFEAFMELSPGEQPVEGWLWEVVCSGQVVVSIAKRCCQDTDVAPANPFGPSRLISRLSMLGC
jgi:hypothetical protein